jgi:hypothetical protein
MKRFAKTILPLGAALTVAVMPLLSAAQLGQKETVPTSPIRTPQDVLDFLNNMLNWLFTIFMLAAVAFVILAAFSYLTAGGDPEKVKTASNRLIYAAVAIGVALLAEGLRYIVRGFLQRQ